MNLLYLVTGAGLPTGPVGSAGGAKQLEVRREATMAAPVDAVWAVCGDFNAIERWLSGAVKTTLKRGQNNAIGTIRHIDVKGGGFVEEELLAYDAGGHSFKYRILAGVLPVSDYQSDFVARASGPGKTVVAWSSTFRRKDTGPEPGADANDKAALGAITGLYESGLADLKRAVERR